MVEFPGSVDWLMAFYTCMYTTFLMKVDNKINIVNIA